jgi:hypothetical protein
MDPDPRTRLTFDEDKVDLAVRFLLLFIILTIKSLEANIY